MADLLHTNAVIADDLEIAYAELKVFRDYGDIVSVAQKAKSLNKFGRTEEVTTTPRTIAQLGSGESHETYQTSNTIDYVVSSDGADTQSIVVEGHTIDADGEFTFVVQSVTLTGQTKAPLTTPLARCSRMYNNGSTNLAGTVYAFRDTTVTGGVPQTAANIHCTIPITKNQSFKAATTISKSDYYFIRVVYVSVNKKAAADVDVELEIRLKGKVFRQQFPLSVSTDGVNTFLEELRPMLIVPKNADVRLTASALAGSAIAVSGGFNGYLAKVVG